MPEEIQPIENKLDTNDAASYFDNTRNTEITGYKEAEQRAFLYWMTLTDQERKQLGQPRTHTQFAEKFGINANSLTVWKARPQFRAAYCALIKEKYGYRLGSVSNALVREAEAGDVQAMKLFFEWQGEIKQPGTVVQIEQSVTLQELVRGTADNWEPPTWAQGEAIDVVSESVPGAVSESARKAK